GEPLRGYQFAGGLIDEVELDAERFAEYAEVLRCVAPAAALRLHTDGWQSVKAVVRYRALLSFCRLSLVARGQLLGGAGARILAESPTVANLKALGLAGQGLGQPGTQGLVGSRYLTHLEALDLSENNLS